MPFFGKISLKVGSQIFFERTDHGLQLILNIVIPESGFESDPISLDCV
jgi:hypothetical protein